MKPVIKGILFDLDGTLLDTAPDMALALNIQRELHDLAPLPYSEIRPYVSHGAVAMLRIGFGIGISDANFNAMREQYLHIYSENIAVKTDLFDGLGEFLKELERIGIKWGVVTNKPEFLTIPLLTALNLNKRSSTVISGDTIEPRKPNPAPLFAACKQAALIPSQCIYVGDAERDIAAGRAAGMRTVLAQWGYITPEDNTDCWEADITLEQPDELYSLLSH
ncbi:HAD-IA family hydrolase [Kangiella geojedonensis]|uniref:Phosphoglycolate phosphatase n=1 Tax=Kangiella geojedonensis TaxID=914150 RepID=A0A0F6RCG4_9GAMM|nr:HAD-IA family hydrolase [Kangiella geojedonensis]AKE52383.1 Phosphoglycolate phosphatase [Kangiella geojedonensis]